MKKTDESKGGESPSQLIDARIKELGDWRGETLSKIRKLIKKAAPTVIEEWKWRGVPVWSHGGILCTGETYKSIVKLTFAKGARLKDPKRLFNASLEGNMRRAIDLREGEQIDEGAFEALICEAAALNESSPVSMRKLPASAAEDLLELIMRRYERASTIVTSNRPLEDRGKLFGDTPAVTAFLDRLMHHSHFIEMRGKSYRLHESSKNARLRKASAEPEIISQT